MTGKSILLVEDDGILAAHTEDVLASLGYRVIKPVATGEAAIAAVASCNPDLILMDIELAGPINGVETARRIHQSCEVPIVYLTGYSHDPLLKTAVVTSPYGYLVKPVPERELAAAIEVALYRHQADQEILASRKALRESEERFRTLFECMSEGVALHDLVYDSAGKPVDYRIVAVNPAFENQTGLAGAGCVGRLASELYGAGKAPYLDRYTAVATTGEPITFDTYFAPLARHFAISVASPRPGSFATVFMDVTERTRLAQALAGSQAELRAIYESAPVMMCVIGGGYQVLYANAAFQGYRPHSSDASGPPGNLLVCVNSLRDPRGCGFSPDCGRCELRRLLDTTLEQRRSISEVQCTLPLLFGEETRECVFLASAAVIETGEEPRLLLCLSDITRRHQAEEAIRRSEENYRGLIEGLPDGVVVHVGGRILFANAEAARILGVKDGNDLLGAGLDSFVHPASLDLVRKRRASMEDGVRSLPAVELRFTHAGGDAIDVEASSVAVTYQGKPAVHSVFRDITARKLLEQQLHHAQKMESVGRLAGGIAHDFNNLLTVINGYSQMLLSALHPADPMHVTVAEINRAGERAAALTRQLLAFSRKQVMQPRLIDLNAVVTEMRTMLQRLLGETIELRVEPGLLPMMVDADPHQFEQVIMNMVINARDALPNGGRVTVSTASANRNGVPWVVLTVADNGVGMDEETRKRIFEPFFTTKGPGKGTGLGLAMVQGIVEQSGGLIDVQSEAGHGASFRIYLPRAAGDAGASAPAPAPDSTGGHETILLVEDQPEVREFCAAALTSYGYRVLRADGPASALDICALHGAAIDLVLSDVVMPDISGPELASRLAVLRPGLKVLFMSGYAEKELADQGLIPDRTLLLEKPFQPRDLALRVRQALGRSGPGPTVLVIDGEGAVRRLVKAVLQRAGYRVLAAGACDQALAIARDQVVDCVIADPFAPGLDPAGSVRLFRQQLPGAAIVVLSGGEAGADLESLRAAGAAAVLGKPVAPERLVAAVKQALAARSS